MVKNKAKSYKKKIIHIISGDIYGGAEAQILNTLRALKNEANFIVILYHGGILYEQIRNINVPTYIVPKTFFFIHLIQILIQFYKLKPDIIHTHRSMELFLAFLYKFIFKMNTILIRTIHGHSGRAKQYTRLKQKISLYTEDFILQYYTDIIIAVSKNLLLHLKKEYANTSIEFIPNCVSVHSRENKIVPDKFIYKKFNLKQNAFKVGTLSRLVPIKNLELLIEASRILNKENPDITVSIFGDGPQKKRLQTLIDKYHLNTTTFLHGFCEDSITILNCLDVFVLCSKNEGTPMSLLEAMSVGKPCVCTSVGGIVAIINHQENGILISSNSKELADKIIRLKNNPDLYNMISSNAYHTIRNQYGLDQLRKNMLKIYTSPL